jgi:hypothetical protein
MKNLIYVFAFSFALFVSMNLSALCIGCGCVKNYNKCTDCKISACCTSGVIDYDCCQQIKDRCNKCDGVPVCFRFGLVNGHAVIGAGEMYLGWDELDDYPDIKEDLLAQIEPYRDLVDKVLNGQQLTAEEEMRIP